MSNTWRPILGALANPETRQVYAEIVLDAAARHPMPAKRRERAIAALTAAGLLTVHNDGTLGVTADTMLGALSEAAPPRREGLARFVRDGRIEQYPAKPAERLALLEWVAGELLRPGEALTEREVNERLLRFHDDVASLRRQLVDAGLLERTPSGGSYRAIR